MFIAALFTTAEGPAVDERINEMRCRHTGEEYPAFKKMGNSAPTWVYLEHAMLVETSQWQRTNTECLHLWEVPRAVRFMGRTEEWWLQGGGWGGLGSVEWVQSFTGGQ